MQYPIAFSYISLVDAGAQSVVFEWWLRSKTEDAKARSRILTPWVGACVAMERKLG